MRHGKRRFVELVDFITTPGYLSGPGARTAAGLPPGTRSYRVVTDLAVLGYHPQSNRILLLHTQPGARIEQVIEQTDFELLMHDQVTENPPTTAEELRILRNEVDKDRFYN